MPKLPTAKISVELFDALFDEFGLMNLIRNGDLTTEIASEVPATNPHYINCTSRILKHFDANGNHIATTHAISDSEGTTHHWHGKDFLMDEVRLVREAG